MSDTQTNAQVLHTLQEYLQAADETGELRGTRREFTADGVEWVDMLFGGEPPIAARATVLREGHEPTVFYALWSESLPQDDENRIEWERTPHVRLGSFALRASLRTAFPAAIGDRREPDDLEVAPAAVEALPAAVDEPGEIVDWDAELAAVETAAQARALLVRTRDARDPQRYLAVLGRLNELQEQASAAPSQQPEPEPAEAAEEPVVAASVPKPGPPKSKQQTAVEVAYAEAQAAREQKATRRATRGAGA